MAVVAATVGLPAPPACAAGFDFDRYQPTAYAQVLEHVRSITADLPAGGTRYLVDPETHPWRLRVVHTGQVRPLRAGIRRVLSDWGQATSSDPGSLALFDQEMAFETHDGRIWLPIQAPLLEHMEEEARPGAPLDLYVTLLGSLDEEPVLTVNEFQVSDYVD